MSRTIEHIMQCHKDAEALRKQGKPIWNKTIKIKHLLSEDESPKAVVALSKSIANIIKVSVPANMLEGHFDIIEVIDSMEECSLASLKADKKNGYSAVDMFNMWLDEIYDWADRNRIWIE